MVYHCVLKSSHDIKFSVDMFIETERV